MIPLNDLKARFMKDPVSVRLGNIASDLLRASNLVGRSGASIESLNHVINEVKLFTEWTARDLEVDLQENILNLQRELAVSSKSELISQNLKKWADYFIKISGIAN